jgi:hypothetical protein
MSAEFGIDVDVWLNHTQLDKVPPSAMMIRINDSIHDPLPFGEFYLDDPFGVSKEAGMMTEGLPIKICLGTDGDNAEKDISIPFCLERADILDNDFPGLIGGKIKFQMLHEFSKVQNAKTKFYGQTTIDAMVSELFKPSYTSVDTEATAGTDDFWVPGRMPTEYLKEVLLPYAYSSANSDSPYVGFGNMKNVFVFKSLKQLMTASPTVKLKYGPTPTTDNKLDSTVIYDVKPFTNGFRDQRHLWKQQFSAFQEDDLSTDSVQDSTFNHLLGDGSQLPILAINGTNSNYVYDGPVRSQSDDQKKFLTARRNYTYINTYFQERLLVTGMFQPKLWSGQTVEMETYLQDLDADTFKMIKGEYYSGKWLIERCSHTLSGSAKRVITQLVLARKGSDQAGKSSIKGNFIKS